MKELIDKFMAGETDRAEEQRLFEAFASGKAVDPSLEVLRPMMQWYAALPAGKKKTRRPLPRIAAWTGIAAAVAMLVTVGAGYFMNRSEMPEDWKEYSGCYVIRDGVKYTNLAQIMPEIKRAEQLARQTGEQANRAISKALEHQSLPDEIDMSDPEICKIINKVLSDD